MSLSSAHAFIRALKAHADPLPDGERKIELAERAWLTTCLYIPSKAEVIVDWLLSQLLKNPDLDPPPLLDSRYWTLLNDILQDTHSISSRPWLLPILNRIPVIATLTSFFVHASADSAFFHPSLFDIVTRSYAILWSLAVPKTNHDAVIDCFWALLSVAASHVDETKAFDISALATSISEQFSRSFLLSPSKRKICITFVTGHHLKNWLRTRRHASLCVRNAVNSAISTLLFSVDGIRHLVLTPDDSDGSIFTNISSLDPVPSFAEVCIPQLFVSFCQAVHKHQAVLFSDGSINSSSSSSEEACVIFFRSCVSYVELYSEEEKWAALSNLIDVIRAEALYSRASLWQTELAALALKSAASVNARSNDPALILLTNLMRLDYDIISDICPDIYKTLCFTRHVPGDAAQCFTTSALDYACKTRSVDNYVITISRCFKANSFDLQMSYENACRSVFFGHEWRTQIRTSVVLFLSPGQTSHLIDQLTIAVDNGWDKLGIHAVKLQEASEYRTNIIAYALLLSYVTDIFCALFDRSAASPSSQFQNYIVHIIRSCDNADSALSGARIGSRIGLWEHDVLQTCTMRCRYALYNIWNSPEISLPSGFGDLYDDCAVSHELRFELDRMLIRFLPESGDRAIHHVSSLLTRLQRDLDPCLEWDGSTCISHTSPSSQNTAATAIWSSIMHRWLPILNAHASPVHLKQLVELMFRVYELYETSTGENTAISILRTTLADASTWELLNIGTNIVSQMLKDTEGVANVDFSKGVKRFLSKKRHRISDEDLGRAMRSFKFALNVPPTVLTRTSREELLRRAFTADIICATPSDKFHVRNFIARHGSNGLPPLPMELAIHFVDVHNDVEDTNAVNATLDVATFLFARIMSDVSKDSAEALADHFLHTLNTATERPHLLIDIQLLTCYIRQAITFSDASVSVNDVLHAVDVYVNARSHSIISDGQVGSSLELVHCVTLAATARRAYHQWNIPTSKSLDFVPKILSHICATLQESRMLPATLALCTQLLTLLIYDVQNSADRAATVIAAFAIFWMSFEDTDTFDISVGDSVRGLPQASYESLLQESRDFLLSLPFGRQDVCAIIHFSALLCRNVPEGASKSARDHIRTCMSVFADEGLAQCAESIRLEVLRFIESVARDRPMSLQAQDVGQIWLILSQTLSPSASHDTLTSPPQFHAVVGSVLSLLRLRRDLAAPTLPHLAHVLRLLIGALLTPRPQLGAKQLKEVSDQLPRFVAVRADGTGALGAHEARALARLIVALTAKTTIVGRTDDRTSASLARPFARHAPGVLLAYVRAASATLGVLPLAVRRELEPGVFALCAMCGEHGRDSVMAGSAGAVLDAAGKAVLRTLWQQYEKQKYIGTG